MTVVDDALDWRRVCGADGLLAVFNQAGILEAADVHAAQRITELGDESDETVALAVALTVRALRGGSVCVDLLTVADEVNTPDLPWPSPDDRLAAVQASPLQGTALHLYDDRLLYLDRYWREEELVARDLLALAASAASAIAEAALDRLFPSDYAEQREAAETALSQSVTVLTGGPGTGKTTTVARLLALIAEAEDRPRIALAAPTGKAAARLQEAVAAEVARLG